MGKLLRFLDNNILKIGISFLIVFIALYPKFPSVHIVRTWVYIRLEDFFIGAIVIVWLIQLLRKKAKIPWEIAWPFGLYWFFGFLSFVFSLIFIAPTLTNFFPHLAALSYLRRIEYMILFFVAFSSVRDKKDIRDYFITLSIALFGTVLYGLGQRYYLNVWNIFPKFFERYPFCFPSIQTGNEEFAKGTPFCLPENARITSTFAGHYDLGAYLVTIIPIFLAGALFVKKYTWKILIAILFLGSIVLLILTSSRVSFVAYLVAVSSTLVFLKKKKFIAPVIILSIALLFIFSGSTAKRFFQTLRLTSLVTNSQGKVVGELESSLPLDLRKRIATSSAILGNVPTQDLPAGSSYINLPSKIQTTNIAVVKSKLSVDEAKKLALENGGVEITAISGNFLIQKALVYDISLTTRFQAEWPNAVNAFFKNPFLGSGFSTITLAVDNDFLRFLGESGVLGLFSFVLIFILLGVTVYELIEDTDSKIIRAFVGGLSGGVVGLFFNALLIDVFEASKVAESFWILAGIAIGALFLYKKKEINYLKHLKNIFTSGGFLILYIVILAIAVFTSSISHFFTADDFTWLKWVANFGPRDLISNFVNAQGFFYRPLDKTIVFFLYSFFALKPEGYHVFVLLLHLLTAIGVYLLGLRIFSKKILAFLCMFLFTFLSSQAENLFWFATISTTVSSLFIIYAISSFIRFREEGGKIFYILTLILSSLAFLSYEMSVIILPLIILTDAFLLKVKLRKNLILSYVPLVLLEIGYFILRSYANVVKAGGDYSYSLPHLIPNVIGNLFGYFGLFILGQPFLPWYLKIRSSLRSESGVVEIILAVLIFIIIATLFILKDRISPLYKNNKFRIILYGFLFSAVSLSPFLGLGNIAERYGYMASIGFALIAVVVIESISVYILRIIGKPDKLIVVIVLIMVLIGYFYYNQINEQEREWGNAGKITQRTLSYLRLYFPDIPNYSNLYFVNTPIREKEAWIFPVGLSDGVWFIYRDSTIKVYQVSTIEEAKKLKDESEKTTLVKNYIFYFDKNKQVSQYKE